MEYDFIIVLMNFCRVIPIVLVLIIGLVVGYRQRHQRPLALRLFACGVLFEVSSILFNFLSPLLLSANFYDSLTTFTIFQAINSSLVAAAWAMAMWGALVAETRPSEIHSTD